MATLAPAPERSADSTAVRPPAFRRTRDAAAKLRLSLLDDGWRTLDASTDPRTIRPSADDVGRTVSFAYFPEFRQHGFVGRGAMLKNGVHLLADAAAVEVYRVEETTSGSVAWQSLELHTN